MLMKKISKKNYLKCYTKYYTTDNDVCIVISFLFSYKFNMIQR